VCFVNRWTATAHNHHLLVLRRRQHHTRAVITMAKIEASRQANVVEGVASKIENSRRIARRVRKNVATREEVMPITHQK
jgi:hypothetical protein